MCAFVFLTIYILFLIAQDYDEDELEKELEELEQEELDKELLGVGGPSTTELPEVPTGEIAKVPAKEKKKGKKMNTLYSYI